MTMSVWFSLLWRNRFAVSLRCLPLTFAVSIASVANSILRLISEAIYKRRAEATRIEAPVFVIGHWRTGTTLLHELLVKDRRFGFPNTYQCVVPHHFLATDWIFTRWFNWLLPNTRPMDNMPMGFERPQEDEFALMSLGVGSPYLEWAFPNRGEHFDEYLTIRDLDAAEQAVWKREFLWFLRRLALKLGRRFVLKSPTHTARVATLLEMFPDARFVHIVRNPLVVVPSTIRTWNRMTDGVSLQVRRDSVTLDRVLDVFELMYRCFDEDRDKIPAGQLHEIRYEDLVADPVGELETIYEKLDLFDFGPARKAIEQHLEETKDYQPNRWDSADEVSAQIAERCASYMHRYGYDVNPCHA